MAADDWGAAMIKRLKAARAMAPSVERFRPILEDAARAGAAAAQVRRTPAKGNVEVTGSGLQLRFTGPGARHAHAIAQRRLLSTLPPAIEDLHAELARKLRT